MEVKFNKKNQFERENIKELLKTANSQLEYLLEIHKENLNVRYSMPIKVEYTANSMTEEQIENLNYEEALGILKQHDVEVEEFLGDVEVDEEEKKVLLVEKMKEMLKYVIDTMAEIKNITEDRNKILENLTDLNNEYLKNKLSKDQVELRKKEIEELKNFLDNFDEKTDSLSKKRQSEKRVKVLEASFDLSFIYERIKENKREIKSVMDAFFDTRLGNIVMDRSSKKIIKYGYSSTFYKLFISLEEKILEEKYHVYNNLFLFNVMKYIAYTDPNDKNDVTLVSAIMNHLFALHYNIIDNESLEVLKNAMRIFLDMFEENREEFEKTNVTHPKHPNRVKRDEEYQRHLDNEKADNEAREEYIKTLTFKPVEREVAEIEDNSSVVDTLDNGEDNVVDITDRITHVTDSEETGEEAVEGKEVDNAISGNDNNDTDEINSTDDYSVIDLSESGKEDSKIVEENDEKQMNEGRGLTSPIIIEDEFASDLMNPEVVVEEVKEYTQIFTVKLNIINPEEIKKDLVSFTGDRSKFDKVIEEFITEKEVTKLPFSNFKFTLNDEKILNVLVDPHGYYYAKFEGEDKYKYFNYLHQLEEDEIDEITVMNLDFSNSLVKVKLS